MKVDAPFLQTPVAAPPVRPAHQSENTSARPVDRPHHDEAADQRQPQQHVPAGDNRQTAAARDADDGASRSNSRDAGAEEHQQPPRNATEPSQVGNLLDVLA